MSTNPDMSMRMTLIRRDAFGYTNLDGEVAVAMKCLIVDYTEWRELVKEYEERGQAELLTMTREILQTAFDLMEPYLPCVLHYPAGGSEQFGTASQGRNRDWGAPYQARERQKAED